MTTNKQKYPNGIVVWWFDKIVLCLGLIMTPLGALGWLGYYESTGLTMANTVCGLMLLFMYGIFKLIDRRDFNK